MEQENKTKEELLKEKLLSDVLGNIEESDTFEVGATGKRAKLHFNNMDELAEKLAKLKTILNNFGDLIEEMNRK